MHPKLIFTNSQEQVNGFATSRWNEEEFRWRNCLEFRCFKL